MSVFQCLPNSLTQRQLFFRIDDQVGHRQLNRVLFIAVEAGPRRYGDEFSVDAKVGVAFALRPFCQVGVITLACRYQRCQQANVLPFVVANKLGGNLFGRLRANFNVAVGAHLGAQFHV